ncbi:amidase domain-containing protein [Peptostreptococcus stomatis]
MCYGGHMKTDNVWYYHSNAWICVIELRDWLINNNYAEEMDNYKYAMVGDIIQYLNKSNVWRHSVIVTTRTNSYPYVKVTAHSRNRRNVNISGIYYQKGEFKSYRVLLITR